MYQMINLTSLITRYPGSDEWFWLAADLPNVKNRVHTKYSLIACLSCFVMQYFSSRNMSLSEKWKQIKIIKQIFRFNFKLLSCIDFSLYTYNAALKLSKNLHITVFWPPKYNNIIKSVSENLLKADV